MTPRSMSRRTFGMASVSCSSRQSSSELLRPSRWKMYTRSGRERSSLSGPPSSAGGGCGPQFLFDGGDGARVLVLDGVDADLLDDAVLVAAAARKKTLEAHHAAGGPHLAGAVAGGGHPGGPGGPD